MITRTRRSIRGFSLLEIMLSAALLLMLASGVAMLVLHSLAVERQSANYLAALSFAEEGREAVRFMRKSGYAALGTVTEGGVSSDGYGGLRFDGSANLFGSFERKITVSDLSETMKRVDITVTWPGTVESTHSVTLTDYLFNWERPY